MKSWIGIDVGKKGSLCRLYEDGAAFFVGFNLASYIGYLESIYQAKLPLPTMIAVESVSAMPGQGVSSMFSFGQRLGELEGMLQTLHIGYELVRPQAWQKSCQIPAKSGKQGTFEVMSKLYPLAELTGPKGGILDGRCDALGIAHYLRKTYN
jgi:crossover junction endodeoxyribonuclease RuvC